MSYTKSQQVEFIQTGFALLHEKKKYSQAKVVAKLNQINCKVSTSVLSRISKNKFDNLSEGIVNKVYLGYVKLMKMEVCCELNEQGDWISIPNCTPQEIIIEEKGTLKKGVLLHTQGRLDPLEKVKFFSTAQEEMIEFGITLNTFSIYLNNLSPSGFKQSLIELLVKGVKVKCYLLDPEWNGTRAYFDDRETSIKEDLKGLEKIRAALRRLKFFYQEIEKEKYSKNFEVYTYRHFPNNYFLVIDRGHKNRAKMMTSHYLFGMRRVASPVLEFKRNDDAVLFLKYDESLQKIIKKAKKVDLEKIPN